MRRKVNKIALKLVEARGGLWGVPNPTLFTPVQEPPLKKPPTSFGTGGEETALEEMNDEDKVKGFAPQNMKNVSEK